MPNAVHLVNDVAMIWSAGFPAGTAFERQSELVRESLAIDAGKDAGASMMRHRLSRLQIPFFSSIKLKGKKRKSENVQFPVSACVVQWTAPKLPVPGAGRIVDRTCFHRRSYLAGATVVLVAGPLSLQKESKPQCELMFDLRRQGADPAATTFS